MNLMEYKTLSLDFRRTSSNMLMSDADSAFIKLQRFKLFVDSSPVISEIIQSQIEEVEFDFKQCFLIDGSGWHHIAPPVNEASHLKAQYDYMTFLCSQDIDIRDVAQRFYFKKGSWNDIVREFLDKAFKPLVDFVVDSLGKKIMIMGGDKYMGDIIQNIGNNYGNVNAAGRDATINSSVTNNDISEILALIEKLLPTISVIPSAELTDEGKENLIDDMDTIKEQIESSAPKLPRLRKAYENVKKFAEVASKGVTSTTLLLTDWQKLVDKVGEFVGK